MASSIMARMERLAERLRGKAVSFSLDLHRHDDTYGAIWKLTRYVDGQYDTHRTFTADDLNNFIGH